MCAYAVWYLEGDAKRAKQIAQPFACHQSNSALALTMLAYSETANANPAQGLELLGRA
jgi:hypothetical protein